MAFLMQVEVGDASGSSVLVEAESSDLPGELVLAAPNPGEAAALASWTLKEALDRLTPFLEAVRERLSSVSPDKVEVELGVKVGGETGIILTKGTAEANLKITMGWERSTPSL